MDHPILRWTAFPAALLLAGCGGNGAGSDQPATRTVDVYATGEMSRTYSHLWITIDRVVLTNGVSSAPVFDASSTGGLRFDLRTLSGKSGPLYLYLGSKGFETGLFTNAQVTLANELTLVPASGSGSRVVKFSNSKDALETINVDLVKSKSPVPGSTLVLDLDSDRWTVQAGLVAAPKGKFIGLGGGDGLLDGTRHVKQALIGSVTNLDGSGQSSSFTLNTAASPVEVEIVPSPKPSNGKPEAVPTLTEGLPVQVTGTFDPTSGVFRASSIETDGTKWQRTTSGRPEKRPSGDSKR